MSTASRVVARFVASTDRSTHPTVVEYAVQELFKGKSPSAAAKITVKKLSGYENTFLGPGVSTINAKALEEALWDRLVTNTIDNFSRVKPGKEDFALGMTVHYFRQRSNVEAELRKRVVKRLGRDPFPND